MIAELETAIVGGLIGTMTGTGTLAWLIARGHLVTPPPPAPTTTITDSAGGADDSALASSAGQDGYTLTPVWQVRAPGGTFASRDPAGPQRPRRQRPAANGQQPGHAPAGGSQ